MDEEQQIGQEQAGAPQEGAPGERRFGRFPRERVEYETVKLETVNYGTNNFIEISKKKTPNGNLFISLSKGWYPAQSTEKRYKAGIGFPLEKELVDRIMKAFNSVLQE